MFAHAARGLDLPFAEAERRLLARRCVLALDHDGGELLASLGVRVAGLPVYKRVRVEMQDSPVRVNPGRLLLPLRWRAVGGPPIFPRLDGQLELEHVPGGSRLSLSVTYDPPAGRFGELLDRALMHRVAEATLADFLERLVAEIRLRRIV